MRFGVLGPVTVWAGDGQVVRVAELKVRMLLAALLVHAGRPVAASRLIDALWGERLPANPANALQARVSQLRRALAAAEPGGRDLVVSQPPGYLLRVGPEATDAGQFRDRLTRARATADPRQRAGHLAGALALWRGSAYADVEQEPFARAAVDRLEEERLVALEELAEARLAAGDPGPVATDLAELVVRHPFRQRLRAAYLRALALTGRPDQALASYTELRELLAEQLGLDPGPELVALQQAILRQDPALAPPAAAPVPPSGVGPAVPLPAPVDALIGRAEAVARVRDRLAAGRLVTLVGAGGVGKTRLALEVARQVAPGYADGARLVELAAVEHRPGVPEPETVAALVRAVAAALRLPERMTSGVRDGEALVTALAEALAGRRLLLVLDNCEHVIAPAARLTGLLLRSAAGLRVLATSREPLETPGEQIWEVPPLELPPAGETAPAALVRASAVTLFVARAAAAAPGFALGPGNAAAVAAICRRLDGIPLALELAATRVRGRGVHEVATGLDDRFRLLAAGLRTAPARHQTLRAVIDWSWGLLSPAEQAVLRRLALHPDSCTLPAATAICADEGAGAEVTAARVPELLSRLVDRSLLVRVDAPAGVRYRLLESIGAYCLERLHESGEHDRVLRRHLDYYLALDPQQQPRLYGHAPLVDYLLDPAGAGGGPADSTSTVDRVGSRDGTPIAYDRYGSGPPVVMVGGALNDRRTFGPLAARLAERFTVYSYDRRGRGDSGETRPWTVDREIEDLAAVAALAGGPVYAFAVSSGAVLAVEAALHGVPIAALALIEPPFILDGTRPMVGPEVSPRLAALAASGRGGDAVELFLTVAVEMPPEVVAGMRNSPDWAALAALGDTVWCDLEIMGDFQLRPAWSAVTAPALVIAGGESAQWRRHAARRVAAQLPAGRHHLLAGHPHDAPPEILAPLLTGFFTGCRDGTPAPTG